MTPSLLYRKRDKCAAKGPVATRKASILDVPQGGDAAAEAAAAGKSGGQTGAEADDAPHRPQGAPAHS